MIDERIEEYCCEHSSAESSVLQKLNRDTYVKILRPRMISGHLQGQLLKMLVAIHKPKSILEIGTFTGYSAIAMSEGLDNNCTLTTIEKNEELEEFILKYIEESGFQNKINLLIGDALEIITTLNQTFDFIFLDADKINYPKYLDILWNKLNSNGLLIADNVLWYGKVAEEIDNKDKDTQAIDEFNKLATELLNSECIMLPLRDGITIIRKK